MTGLELSPGAGGGRYPGLDVMALSPHWDAATTAVVAARMGPPPAIRFFTVAEVATASALCDRLLDQDEEVRVPVVESIDARLAESQTDGWRYADMPHDGDAWRESLAKLDEQARDEHGCRFHELARETQIAVLHGIQQLAPDAWRGLPAGRVWSLWTRYACTAFYAHPWAWQEMGFTGPAYPRGYKNLGVDRREPFEVGDARPDLDPTRVPTAADSASESGRAPAQNWTT